MTQKQQKQIIVTYHPKFWGKRNRYVSWPKDIEANFDLNGSNLYNYYITETIDNDGCTQYNLAKITDRFIPIGLKHCNLDFSQVDTSDHRDVYNLIHNSGMIHPRGQKKTGVTWFLDREKHAVRNGVIKPKMAIIVEDVSTRIISYQKTVFCGEEVYHPLVEKRKSVTVDGLFVGYVYSTKADLYHIPNKPIDPTYLNPANTKGDGMVKKLRTKYRSMGYRRGVAKRMALEDANTERNKMLAAYQEKVLQYEHELKTWKGDIQRKNNEAVKFLSSQ